MTLIQTCDLEGDALNWAVASYENLGQHNPSWLIGHSFPFISDWGIGGPIIGREDIMFQPDGEGGVLAYLRKHGIGGVVGRGPDHLTAAMRCHVTNKMGPAIDIPDELTALPSLNSARKPGR